MKRLSVFSMFFSFKKFVKFSMSRVAWKQHQIVQFIISPVSINMMDYLFRVKVSSQVFLHHKTMLSDSSIRTRKRMGWFSNTNITKFKAPSAFPLGILFSNQQPQHSFSFTFIRTKFSFLFSAWRNFKNSFTNSTNNSFSIFIPGDASTLCQAKFLPMFFRKFHPFIKRHVFLSLLLACIILANNSQEIFAASEWAKGKPAGSDNASTIDDLLAINNEAIDRLLVGYRRGETLVYATAATITVDPGSIVCTNSVGTIRHFRTNTASTTLTWADLDTGSEANSQTYYVYACADADATTNTFKISTSSTSPTGITYYQRIGSFYNNSSGNIEQVANDDERLIIVTGTAAHGATISLPTGYLADQCEWFVSGNDLGPQGSSSEGWRVYCSVNTSRVITAYAHNSVYGSNTNGTANYIIIGHK